VGGVIGALIVVVRVFVGEGDDDLVVVGIVDHFAWCVGWFADAQGGDVFRLADGTEAREELCALLDVEVRLKPEVDDVVELGGHS